MKTVLLIHLMCSSWMLLMVHNSPPAQPTKANGQKFPQVTVSKTTERSKLALTAMVPAEIPCDTPVALTLTLENRGTETAEMFVGHIHKFQIRMTDSDGKEVPLTRYGQWYYPRGPQIGSAKVKTLVSKESSQEVIPISRLFDLTLPGTYTLSVKRTLNPSSEKRLVLEVEKLSFKMVEPKP